MRFVENHEKLSPDFWVRSLREDYSFPLDLEQHGPFYQVNPRLWVKAKYVFGPVWLGKPIELLLSYSEVLYEFAEDPPKEHTVERAHWLDLSKLS